MQKSNSQVVPQGHHKAKHLLDEHGRPQTSRSSSCKAEGFSMFQRHKLYWFDQIEAFDSCWRLWRGQGNIIIRHTHRHAVLDRYNPLQSSYLFP